jgi:predicted metal-dependent hydrolase
MPRREEVARDIRRMTLGAHAIDYVLVRRRGRRGVGLKVDENGLTVSAPVSLAVSRVESAVRASEAWVLRKIDEWRGRKAPEVAWTDGATVPYLGGRLVLRTTAGRRARADLVGAELRVATPTGAAAEIRRAVIAWYKREAGVVLAERTLWLARHAGLEPPRVFISPALTRWGSCNTRREVRLAWRLVKAPARLADYVICHELAHLKHMNHSRAFWAEVERQCPDYKARRAELFATDHLYRSF